MEDYGIKHQLIKGVKRMSRESTNTYYNGSLKHGFDYDLQVWVENFIIQDCGHPASDINCCNGRKYATVDIRTISRGIKQ